MTDVLDRATGDPGRAPGIAATAGAGAGESTESPRRRGSSTSSPPAVALMPAGSSSSSSSFLSP
ncbi:hypothetical protein ACFSSF_09150 [Dietzia aerolata]|uniref:hypothetical protein n=1 Tax=Dietzia aerolata TaxID=595984 RepID=UPI00363B33B3